MRKFKFEKLVRDKIVQSINEAGNIPHWKTLNDQEFIDELKKKIVEESEELTGTNNLELVKELADIQEIIDSMLKVLNVPKKELIEIQEQKNEKAGSFDNRQYIDFVEAKEDSPWVSHYLSSPEKYPEIK